MFLASKGLRIIAFAVSCCGVILADAGRREDAMAEGRKYLVFEFRIPDYFTGIRARIGR